MSAVKSAKKVSKVTKIVKAVAKSAAKEPTVKTPKVSQKLGRMLVLVAVREAKDAIVKKQLQLVCGTDAKLGVFGGACSRIDKITDACKVTGDGGSRVFGPLTAAGKTEADGIVKTDLGKQILSIVRDQCKQGNKKISRREGLLKLLS